MNLKLKNKKQRKLIIFLCFFMLFLLAIFFSIQKGRFSIYDYKILDYVHQLAVKKGYGPKALDYPRVLYLTITDDSYNQFGKNYLDRKYLAKINNALAELRPQAVAYDIIFARTGPDKEDQSFFESIKNVDNVFLPIGFALSETSAQFMWKKDKTFDRLRSHSTTRISEKGIGHPYFATKALTQNWRFTKAAREGGDISVMADKDSVYRHSHLVVKVDDAYYPTFGFSLFLNWAGIEFGDVVLDWDDRRISLYKNKKNKLESDLHIPIDDKGRIYIPFVNVMGHDFPLMTTHSFLKYFSNENIRGNLTEYFEDNFVIIADVSVGASDLGYTPLEKDTSLVALHANVLNALLSRMFYSRWTFGAMIAITLLTVFLLLGASLFQSTYVLYLTGPSIIIGLSLLTWVEFIQFQLFPLVTIGGITLLVLIFLIITLEIATFKDRKFIQETFSKYVPKKVVSQLLNQPELVQLGGEESIITVLFSDIADFTKISESMPPKKLVGLLNEYFTEMTAIILEEDGIIDKYVGDAIMAEFGVPLPIEDHADRAVMAALKMQNRLVELRQSWAKRGLPELHCRVGINTNKMIVGNIGSQNVFDYTVIGDAVNLASRLEGANKRYGTSLIVSEDTFKQLTKKMFKIRILDYIAVKGKEQPTLIYEIYGLAGGKDEGEEYYNTYDKAFRAYLSGNFSEAKSAASHALSLKKGDVAVTRLVERIDRLIEKGGLPENWDAAVSLSLK